MRNFLHRYFGISR